MRAPSFRPWTSQSVCRSSIACGRLSRQWLSLYPMWQATPLQAELRISQSPGLLTVSLVFRADMKDFRATKLHVEPIHVPEIWRCIPQWSSSPSLCLRPYTCDNGSCLTLRCGQIFHSVPGCPLVRNHNGDGSAHNDWPEHRIPEQDSTSLS
jgi:hypothetical protein